MEYKISNINNKNEYFIIGHHEMQVLLNNGIFDDCPDETNNPNFDENDDTIVGVFADTNIPIITHRLKYYIKTSNNNNQNILDFLVWITNKNSPLIINEIND